MNLAPRARGSASKITTVVFGKMTYGDVEGLHGVHGVGPNQVGDIRRNDLERRGAFGSITLFLGVKRPILGSLAYISLVSFSGF